MSEPNRPDLLTARSRIQRSDVYDSQADRSQSQERAGATAASDPACDLALIAILESERRPGESHAGSFRRKEHELGAKLATQTPAASLMLERRLVMPAKDDALAQRFSRLVGERRTRLLGVLAHARRSRRTV